MDVLQTDFLIVGASVAGCALAAGLKAKGYRVCVVEQERTPSDHFKGEYLQPFAHEFLRDLGFGEALSGGMPIHNLRFSDLGTQNCSVMSHGNIDYPAGQPALAIRYLKLVSGLRSHMRKYLGEMFFEGATLEPNNAESSDFMDQPRFCLRCADGNFLEVHARIVMGCDGRQSKTRGWMDGPKPVKKAQTVLGAPTEFIVGCEIANTLTDHRQYEVIRSNGQGTLSVFALNPQHCRVYWSAPAKFHRSLGGSPKVLWAKKIQSLFKQANQSLALKFEGELQPAGMPAFTAWYGPAQQGKFFLAGDSLAVTTPFGGQGMTCACLHAQTLLDLFKDGIPHDAKLQQLGKTYGKKTRSIFAHFNFLNTGIYHLFFSRHGLSKLATRHVLEAWAREPTLADRLGRLFGGIDQNTPELTEVFALWGLQFPDIQPLKATSAKLELHRALVPLMKWSNQASQAQELKVQIVQIKQRIFDFEAIAKIRRITARIKEVREELQGLK